MRPGQARWMYTRRSRRSRPGPRRRPAALPPAYTEVTQLDMFRDEGLASALRLGQVGVPVEFHLHPGAPRTNSTHRRHTTAGRRAIADRALSSTGCPVPHRRLPGSQP
jgi:acetyl esterase/lipase